jgi:hypothetical protein
MSPPSSGLKSNPSRNQHEQAAKKLLGFLFNMKIEVTCSSETSVDFQQTTSCYIPENRSLQNHSIIALFTQQQSELKS